MMSEPQPHSLGDRVNQLATAAIEREDPTSWFEPLYVAAAGDPAQIPWAKLEPHPDIQAWLAQSCGAGAGRRALMVGCGLGDDAEDLQQRGWRVTAFDIAPSAIAWCKQRFLESAVAYQVADLLNPPPEWHQAFDLVVECRNVQALPLSVRARAVGAIASLVAPQGTLLVVTRLRPAEAHRMGIAWKVCEPEDLLAEARRHERLVEHERGLREASLDVAVRPLDLRLAHRHPALVVLGEVGVGPLHFLDFERTGRLPLRGLRASPGVALDPR
ncbi:MAG: class I SAM-dependent methyltransferase, partial [Alkalinema sp. RL_2_19]|nr:class I SAM-dependent methyltransferase [Alkalinema sp. RL_2_19]